MARSTLHIVDIQIGGSWQDRDAVVAGSYVNVVDLHVVWWTYLDSVSVRAISGSHNPDACDVEVLDCEEVEVTHFAIDRFDAAESRESHELEAHVHR